MMKVTRDGCRSSGAKKCVNYSMEQTVEQTLDEVDYDRRLYSLVRQMGGKGRAYCHTMQRFLLEHVLNMVKMAFTTEGSDTDKDTDTARLHFESFCYLINVNNNGASDLRDDEQQHMKTTNIVHHVQSE
jgi:hypothetical protein